MNKRYLWLSLRNKQLWGQGTEHIKLIKMNLRHRLGANERHKKQRNGQLEKQLNALRIVPVVLAPHGARLHRIRRGALALVARVRAEIRRDRLMEEDITPLIRVVMVEGTNYYGRIV